MAKAPKTRNPQDSTRRNVQAAKKRDELIWATIKRMQVDIYNLETLVKDLPWQFAKKR